MTPPAGSRTLLVICGAMVLLLAALAAVQYRWATRVAAADLQREREHLASAAGLFSGKFNAIASRGIMYLQTQAWPALQSGKPLEGMPPFIGELDYADFSNPAAPQDRRLSSGGVFLPAPLPSWIPIRRCVEAAIEQPAALVEPVYEEALAAPPQPGKSVAKAFEWRSDRCFIARIDESYLRDSLFPQLIASAFGKAVAGEYDFAVSASGRPRDLIYGNPLRPDFRQSFFSLNTLPTAGIPSSGPPGRSTVRIQRMQAVLPPALANLYGPGIWELRVARKGAPLASAFNQVRKRNLIASLLVELLLCAAIAFLATAMRRTQHLAEQKMRFVAGVSHELRTPASSIAMLSRNLADGLIAEPDRVKQYGELIHQQSRRLNEMVEQALQYAAIQSSVRPAVDRPLDLRDLIDSAVAARNEEFTRAGFHVETDLAPDLPSMSGDPRILRTALDNLLANALKHAGRGRWIRVTADYSAAEKRVCIRIADRGDGIAPEDQTAIFEPFYRGKTAVDAQIPGSGLGLSLVRRAAEIHRGAVTLESAPGRGCTFTMHLPI